MKREIVIKTKERTERFEMFPKYYGIFDNQICFKEKIVSIPALAALVAHIYWVDIEKDINIPMPEVDVQSSDIIKINSNLYIFSDDKKSIIVIKENSGDIPVYVDFISLVIVLEYFKEKFDEEDIKKYYNYKWLEENVKVTDTDVDRSIFDAIEKLFPGIENSRNFYYYEDENGQEEYEEEE